MPFARVAPNRGVRSSTGTVGMGTAPVGARSRMGRGSVYGAADPAFKKSQDSAAKALKAEAKKQMRGRGPKSMPMPVKGKGPRRRNSVMTGRSRGKPYRSY